MALSAHAQQKIGEKIPEVLVQFCKFLVVSVITGKLGAEKSNLRSNFTQEVVLWPFLRMRTKSGQDGYKPGQNSGYVRNQARRT